MGASNVDLRLVRGCGVAGALGGLVLFVGDMLFYCVPESANLVHNMSIVSLDRILASGLLSLASCWLYLAGAAQVYLAFQPAAKVARVTVGIGMVMVMSGFGLVHANYVAIALTARLALRHGISLDSATQEAVISNDSMRYVLYAIFAPVSLAFFSQVWCHKTHYPRWMCAAYPLLMLVLQWPLSLVLQGDSDTFRDLRLVIIGGYLNLTLVVFFTCSTAALWHVHIPASLSPTATALAVEVTEPPIC